MKILFALIGLVLFLWSLSRLKGKSATTGHASVVRAYPDTKSQKQVIGIEDISIIWSKRKEAKIRLEELATLWRNYQKQTGATEKIHFYNPIILDFFKRHIEGKPFFTGSVRKVLLDLLTLLDTEGSVSSVVSGQTEVESKLPANTYQMLSQISLAEHTVHVAEEILAIVPFGPNIPKALITALAHDIGKIPKFRKQYYALGDHPFISVTVLDSMQSFKELVYADDIIKAIRDHHLKPKEYLGEALKEADQRARRRELSQIQKTVHLTPPTEAEIEQSEPNVPDISEFLPEPSSEPNPKPNSTKPTTKQHFQNQTQQPPHQTPEQTFSSSVLPEPELSDLDKITIPDIFQLPGPVTKPNTKANDTKTNPAEIFISTDEQKEKVQEKPEELELDWFNVEEFLQQLLTHVNVLVQGRWLACSMPNGIVYVQPRLVWMILKSLAVNKGIHDVFFAESDEALKRNYLYTVLKQIQHHKNAVETSLIQEGYFSAPFVVRMKTGETYRTLYIPLRAYEAFGISVGELEARKEGKLKDIDAIIPPYSSEEDA